MSNATPNTNATSGLSSPNSNASRRTGRRSTRRWLPWFGLVLLAALIAAGFRPQPAPVETARVIAAALNSTVNEEGRTRIKQRYVVSAPVAGQLRRIPFKAGAEIVARETVLAVIDPIAPTLLDARSRSLAEARRDTAVAQLAKAREALRFAETELRRFEKLFAEGSVSSQELEGVQWRQTSATKEIAAAESGLRQAEAELDQFVAVPGGSASGDSAATFAPAEVRAPVSGRVLRVIEENARVVAPGMALLEIGDPTDLEVVIEVLSRDGAAIQPGASVELDQWGGNEPLQARVRLVEPAAFTKVSALGVEEQRVNVIADLLTPVDRRPSLGDQFRVETRIVVWETDRTLQVPSGALFRKGNSWAAFVVTGGRARLRSVEAGRSNGRETQILGGLNERDEVILYPGDRITEGQRVRPIQIAR